MFFWKEIQNHVSNNSYLLLWRLHYYRRISWRKSNKSLASVETILLALTISFQNFSNMVLKNWKSVSTSIHWVPILMTWVKSVKSYLSWVIGEPSVTNDELQTLLTQNEALLNSRHLRLICSHPNDVVKLYLDIYLNQG